MITGCVHLGGRCKFGQRASLQACLTFQDAVLGVASSKCVCLGEDTISAAEIHRVNAQSTGLFATAAAIKTGNDLLDPSQAFSLHSSVKGSSNTRCGSRDLSRVEAEKLMILCLSATGTCHDDGDFSFEATTKIAPRLFPPKSTSSIFYVDAMRGGMPFGLQVLACWLKMPGMSFCRSANFSARFRDWVGALCRVQGIPVPPQIGEISLEMPEPPPRPLFRDLVRAYEQVLQHAGKRKRMGMYYTPPALMDCLLETALEPCVERCLCGENPREALMGLRILDPSCGAGDFLLAAARRVAQAVTGVMGNVPPLEMAEVLHGFVECGIFGVDQDPVAVELTRLNLYLASGVWPGDHIACGNALVGVVQEAELRLPVPDAAYGVLPGDDADWARLLCRLNREERNGNSSSGVETQGNCWHDGADLAIAPFLLPKNPGVAVPLSRHVRQCLRGELPPDTPELLAARDVCRRERVWHWLGAFGTPYDGSPVLPQFDCVLGNPPWEKLQINEREWSAAPGKSLHSRRAAPKPLPAPDPTCARWEAELEQEKKRLSAVARYLRCCPSRLPESCSGIINLYVPFLWLAVQLCAPGGRVGMVVPTGLMNDRGTFALFQSWHEGGFLRHFYDFENRRLLFPSVDRRQRFACVTLSCSPSRETARFAFFLGSTDELRVPGRAMKLPSQVFRRLNPGTQGGVSFRCEADARLALNVHERMSQLGDAWRMRLRQGLFNMTADQRLFSREKSGDVLPLYEGRMFHLFEPRFGGYADGGSFGESAEAQLDNPYWQPGARYWVPREAVLQRLPQEVVVQGWLPVFRMVTSPTNERSFICSIVPVAGVGNSAGLLLPRVDDPRLLLCLVANLSSLVFDYQVRLKLSGNNLNFHIVKQLPVLPPEAYSEADRHYVAQRVLRLLYTWHGLDMMSAACGGPARPYARGSETDRAELRAELEAWYACRYGLNRSEFAYLLDPSLAPELPGNAAGASTFAILRAREKASWGEFRTARLSLAAYDALAASEN